MPENSYGQPIGITIPSGEHTLMAAVAVREGEKVEPYVPGLASAISKASKACLEKGQAELEFEVTQGVIRFLKKSDITSEKCLADALNGKTISESTVSPIHARLQVFVQ